MRDDLARYENLLRWQSDESVRKTLKELIAELKRTQSDASSRGNRADSAR